LSALAFLWVASLVLAASAIGVMILLVIARVVRDAQARRSEAVRRRLVPLFLAASEKGPDEALVLTARDHLDVAADLAIEMFGLIRGEGRARLAQAFHDVGITAVLKRRLVTGDERARTLAVETLPLLADASTVETLTGALGDRSGEVRLAAAMSLAQVGALPPLNELVDKLDVGEAHQSRRVMDFFRQIAEERTNELLALARDHERPVLIRAAAVEALGSTGNYAVVDEIAGIASRAAAADQPLVAQCVRALGELRHPRGAEIVSWALQSHDWQVRAEAVEAAGRIGLVEAAPRLGALLADDVWWVRFRAAEALAELGDQGRLALQDLADHGSGRAQRTASLVLVERGLA
jgi:HEAT repeat protein